MYTKCNYTRHVNVIHHVVGCIFLMLLKNGHKSYGWFVSLQYIKQKEAITRRNDGTHSSNYKLQIAFPFLFPTETFVGLRTFGCRISLSQLRIIISSDTIIYIILEMLPLPERNGSCWISIRAQRSQFSFSKSNQPSCCPDHVHKFII